MKILDLSSEHLSGSPKDAASLLCDEEPVAIFINGRHISTVLLGSGNIREYVTGYLFTEQYIKTADEIESIRVEKPCQCSHDKYILKPRPEKQFYPDAAVLSRISILVNFLF